MAISTRENLRELDLRQLVRDVPDFPKPGILFKDISPLLGDPEALQYCCKQMAAPFKMPGNEVDAVAAAEAPCRVSSWLA